MRRRIMALATGTALLAVALLAIPLGVLVGRNELHDERVELQQAAASAAARARGDSPAAVPTQLEQREFAVTVYDTSGRRRSGAGPMTASPIVRAALAGRESSTTGAASIAVTAPVSDGDRVIAALLVTSNLDAVHRRTRVAWLALGAMCVGAVLLSAGGAALVSRRLVAPVDRLTEVSQRIGAGDLTVRAAPSGVVEVDVLAGTLNDSVVRIRQMVDRERSFSAEVSHQLRTPLAGLQLQLDAARAVVGDTSRTPHVDHALLAARLADASAGAERLSRTIEDVIGLARNLPVVQEVDVAELTGAVEARWHGVLAAANRPLRVGVSADSPASIGMSRAAATQIVDVLMDNAWRHGEGAVSVRILRDDSTVVVQVSDAGGPLQAEAWQLFRPPAGPPERRGHGIGLPYARRLAEAEGARVVLAAARPPTFALIVPIADAGRVSEPVDLRRR